MKKPSIIIALSLFVFQLYSQSVNFLNYPTDARFAALGNCGFVLPSPFSVQRNISTSIQDSTTTSEIGASYLLWQPNISAGTLINVAGYSKFDNLSIGAGIRYNSLEAIITTDEHGNINGAISPVEYAIDLGFGYKITNNVIFGVSIRYVNSNIGSGQNASIIASDISFLYTKNKLKAGLGLTNFGSKVNYGYSIYNTPLRIQSGISYVLYDVDKHLIQSVADVAYQLVPLYSGVIGGLGVEYVYKKLLFLRSGYHYENNSIGSSYSTFGVGGFFSNFSLDLAYMLANSSNPVNQSILVSLKWKM